MRLRICRLLAIAAFVSCVLASAQTLAQELAYITNQNSNSISVIDTLTNELLFKHQHVGSGPFGVAADGNKVYVANIDSDTISVILVRRHGRGRLQLVFSIAATIPVGTNPFGVAVAPDGSKVYVANVGSGSVSVIATVTNAVIATIPVAGARAVAVAPDGNKVYVANTGSNNVSVIDTATNTETATIDVGDHPVAFGMFIQSLSFPTFVGTPGFSNCEGQSIAALDQQFGGRNAAAAALGFPDARALENAVLAFCRE